EPAGVQAVDGADAGGDRLADVFPIERSHASSVDSSGFAEQERAFVVHRLAKTVEHAPEELLRTPDPRCRGDVLDLVAARYARDARERHEQRAVIIKADDLGGRCFPA